MGSRHYRRLAPRQPPRVLLRPWQLWRVHPYYGSTAAATIGIVAIGTMPRAPMALMINRRRPAIEFFNDPPIEARASAQESKARRGGCNGRKYLPDVPQSFVAVVNVVR